MRQDVVMIEDLPLLGSVHSVWSLGNERLQGGKGEKRRELSKREEEKDREGEEEHRASRGGGQELGEGQCATGGR